ncbi:MAG: FlgD immunoglobulin-like domain containing protein [Armatimonadota bacterium]
MSDRLRGGRVAAALAALLALASAVPAIASEFRNVVNEPFATVSNGPQGAIVVDESAVSTAGAGNAVSAAIRTQHSVEALARARHSLETLKRLGLKSPRARASFPRRMVRVRDGRIVAPDLMRALQTGDGLGGATNELRFTFEGFAEAEETALRDYLSRALPVAYNVYGRPAFDLDLTVILDENLQELQGGVYDASANELRLAPLSGNFAEDSFIFLIMVLQAFHDDAGLFYDAWEQGLAGAAATVIQTRAGVAPGYDPIDPGPFYATSVYEPQNQPDLGGPSFYPPSGWAGMLVWRVAMARSAWFKCWVEDNEFFRRFNRAYYDAFTETLPGDVPALRVLAAQVVPEVEGLPFQEWFQRQWVLDTSVRIGPKLFVWNIPLTQSVALIAEHFYTTFEGDEQPRGGQARTTYWSYDFRTSLYAEEGNTISIPASGDGAGEGFLIPTFFNIGGPQNITVQVDLGSLRRDLPFPYGQRGFELGENNLYGCIVAATQGSIDVEGGAGLEDVAVQRGVWGDRITQAALTPQQLRVTFTNQDEQSITRAFNVAWDSYVTFLHGGQQESLTKTWSAAPPGLHLISFPVRPLTQDLAAVLGIDPERLLVARWDPSLPGESKYAIWPRTEPVAPGRGYWLRIFDDVTVSLQGVQEPEERPVVVPLKVGWNMIGPPRTEAVEVASLQFAAEGEAAVDYAEAVDRGIIQEGIFGYSSEEGYAIEETLQPFAGYWIRCLRADGALMRFPAVNVSSAQAPASADPPGGDLQWRLPIVAEAGGMRGSAWIGAAPDATDGLDRHDLQAPPDFGPRVSVRLDPAGDGSAAYISDVHPPDGEGTYSLRVLSTLPGRPVRLSWPDLSRVPDHLAPVLVDEASGRRMYMRTSAGMELPGGEEGVDRRLQVELNARGDGPLMVSAMSAMQTAGSTAQIVFSLSVPADVEVSVLNIAGRPIRTLGGGLQAPGQTTLSWNLRDNGGRLVPGGLYLVRLRARDDSGRQTQALRPLQVAR